MTKDSIVTKDNSGYVMVAGEKFSLDTPNLEQVLKNAYAKQNGTGQIPRFAMEFPCGGCCKRLSNIFTFGTSAAGLLFAGALEGECMVMETFCEGKLVDKQILSTFMSLVENLCAIEFYNQGS